MLPRSSRRPPAGRPSSLACFDFAGEVEVAVTHNGGDVRSAQGATDLVRVSTPIVEGKTLHFRLSEPRNLSIGGMATGSTTFICSRRRRTTASRTLAIRT